MKVPIAGSSNSNVKEPLARMYPIALVNVTATVILTFARSSQYPINSLALISNLSYQ